ncbi:MAG: hypothetical protein AAF612_09665 [Planctomycetota bacterium]
MVPGGVGFDLVEHDVGRHDGGDAGVDGFDKRRQLAGLQLVDRVGHAREVVVAVDVGVAVAREVLGARRDALLLHAPDQGRAQLGHAVRVGAERAVADHRVRGVGVQVEHRGEVQVEAGGPQLAPDQTAQGASPLGVAQAAELTHRRRRRKPPGQTHHAAALLVDHQQHPPGRPLADRLGQGQRRGGLTDVAREERDRPDPAVEPGGQVVVDRPPGEADAEQPRDPLVQGVADQAGLPEAPNRSTRLPGQSTRFGPQRGHESARPALLSVLGEPRPAKTQPTQPRTQAVRRRFDAAPQGIP